LIGRRQDSGASLLFEAIALAPDGDHVTVMQQAIGLLLGWETAVRTESVSARAGLPACQASPPSWQWRTSTP
jgi:hypothetical protein